MQHLVDIWDEAPLDDATVLLPVLSVLALALLKVTAAAVSKDSKEEDRVEQCDGGVEASTETPSTGLDPVGSVVGLAEVCPPPRSEELVAVLGLDESWVLDNTTREVGECSAVNVLLSHLEGGLLAHGSVKDVVADKQSGEHGGLAKPREVVGLGVGADHVDDGVAVCEGYTCHVPEDEHPSKLLMEHVPGLGDHVLALGAGVHVETSRKKHVEHAVRDVAEVLVLLYCTGEGEKKEQNPGDTNFSKHLEVDGAETGVEGDAHEVVVDCYSRETNRLASVVHGAAEDINGSRNSE